MRGKGGREGVWESPGHVRKSKPEYRIKRRKLTTTVCLCVYLCVCLCVCVSVCLGGGGGSRVMLEGVIALIHFLNVHILTTKIQYVAHPHTIYISQSYLRAIGLGGEQQD